jgi:hypothetical protein
LAKNRPDLFYGQDDSEIRDRREKEKEEALKAVWEKQREQQISKMGSGKDEKVEKPAEKPKPAARQPAVISAAPMPPTHNMMQQQHFQQQGQMQMMPPQMGMGMGMQQHMMPPMGFQPGPPVNMSAQQPAMPRPPVAPMAPTGFPMVPPGAPPMMPMLPGMHAPPVMPGYEQPPLKRQRVEEKKVVEEDEFAAQNPGTYTINVSVPNDPENKKWNFNGQILAVNVEARETVESLKKKISDQLGGMPDKKMKINIQNGQFLNNDKWTLAKYNIGPSGMLQVAERTRGGKK